LVEQPVRSPTKAKAIKGKPVKTGALKGFSKGEKDLYREVKVIQ